MSNNQIRKLQLTELEILDEIDKICKKNNIKYFLVGGTLLGAVRHKGFIPWDDDIDIAMLRSDYDKFIDICLNGGISSKYFLHCDKTDKNYWLPYVKVRKNNTTFLEKDLKSINSHKGIFVDIFPYDNIKYKKEIFLKIRGLISRSIIQTVFVKRNILTIKECHNSKMVCFFNLFSLKRLLKINKNIMYKYNDKETEKIISYAGSYNIVSETLDKNEIFPLKKIKFENKNYYCFKNPDYYLKRLYGDYMKLPPKDKQVAHIPEKIDFNKGINLVTKDINKE